MSVKEKLISEIGSLPDDASYDDVIYHIQFIRKLEVAIAQSDADDVMSQEDFEKELFGEELGKDE